MFTWSTARPSTRPVIHQHSWHRAVGLDVGYNVDTETREMLHLPEYEGIFDDVAGAQLPPEKVDLARRKEIEFLLVFPRLQVRR